LDLESLGSVIPEIRHLHASSPPSSVPAGLSAAELHAAFTTFAASTAQLAHQDDDLRRSVEQLRADLALTHSRLHAEMRRRVRSEEQADSMFSSAPFGLLALEDGRISAFNPAALRLLPGLTLNSIWAVPAHWRRRGASNEYSTDRGPDARVVSVSLLSEPDSPTQLWRIEDVTGALRERERAERQERLAAMGRMSAELAHQLRTPLCTATLHASRLAEPDLAPEERQQTALRLAGQLRQLDGLINRMLGFLKTSARDRELSAIEPLVQAQLELIGPQLQERALRLDLRWQAPDCVIPVDRLQIGSAVLALLENAMQHSPPGSTLSVACVSQGHRVEISVADEGPGIAPDMSARLFEPFASGRAAGSGLGLAIARAAAQAHRGELSCQPRQPNGTCFILALPALPAV